MPICSDYNFHNGVIIVQILRNQRNGNAAFIVGKNAYIVRDAFDGDDGHDGSLQMIAMENGNRRAVIPVGQSAQLIEARMLVNIRNCFLKIKGLGKTGRWIL